MMEKFILSLGSNMGDTHKNLSMALSGLSENGIEVLKSSEIYVTSPWGKTDQPDFLNMCVLCEADITPHQLLDTIHQIEASLGRKRLVHWGERTVDIDIIVWQGVELDTADLIIPHKFWLERSFVLAPLLDIFPEKNALGFDFSDSAVKYADEIYKIRKNRIKGGL